MKRLPIRLICLFSALLLVLSLSACAGDVQKPVGSCVGQEILYEELRFQTLLYLEKHESCSEDELWAGVESALREHYAILALCKEHLPELTPESETILEAVEEEIQKAITAQGGKSAYKKMLKERYMTDNLMRKMLAVTHLQLELEKKIFAETELENTSVFTQWLKDGNFVRARQIFFPAEMEGAEVIASAARTALRGGTKLSELLTSDQLASGAKLLPADYFFRGLNGTSLEEAALELDALGDVSDVIPTEDGYSLLVRVEDPLTASTSNEQTQAQNDQSFKALAETAFTRFREKRLSAQIDEAAEQVTVEWNDFGKSIRLSEMK